MHSNSPKNGVFTYSKTGIKPFVNRTNQNIFEPYIQFILNLKTVFGFIQFELAIITKMGHLNDIRTHNLSYLSIVCNSRLKITEKKGLRCSCFVIVICKYPRLDFTPLSFFSNRSDTLLLVSQIDFLSFQDSINYDHRQIQKQIL